MRFDNKKNWENSELLQLFILIVSENACKLDGNDGPFTIADFGTADGQGFIQIIPDLVGKKYFIYMSAALK